MPPTQTLKPEALHRELPGWLDRIGTFAGEGGRTLDPHAFLSELAVQAITQSDFRRKLADGLAKSAAVKWNGDLAAEQKEELERMVTALRGRMKDAGQRMKETGLNLRHPTYGAFYCACASAKNKPVDEITADELRQFLQDLYEETRYGKTALTAIIGRLEAADTDTYPMAAFYARHLGNLKNPVPSVYFQACGVVLRPAEEVYEERNKAGGARQGVRGRAEHKTGMTPDELEKARIAFCWQRGFKYAGRRKNIVDAEGRAPYFSSIHHANWARHLDRQRKRWVYKPRVFHYEVPETAGISQKDIIFEPTFYLPDEDRYLFLLDDRRFGGVAGSKEERLAWLKVVQQLSGLTIGIVQSEEIHALMEEAGMESLARRKNGRKIDKGVNIHTKPEKFLLPETE